MFVGSGAAKNDLEAAIAARGLANVQSFPRQAKEDMPAVWQICDVSLVSLRDAELFRQVIPSKIFESMASGLPMILSMPQGEAVDLVTGDKAGIWCCPENPQALADAVLKLQGGPELRKKMAGAGVKSVVKYDRSNLALNMLAHLENAV